MASHSKSDTSSRPKSSRGKRRRVDEPPSTENNTDLESLVHVSSAKRLRLASTKTAPVTRPKEKLKRSEKTRKEPYLPNHHNVRQSKQVVNKRHKQPRSTDSRKRALPNDDLDSTEGPSVKRMHLTYQHDVHSQKRLPTLANRSKASLQESQVTGEKSSTEKHATNSLSASLDDTPAESQENHPELDEPLPCSSQTGEHDRNANDHPLNKQTTTKGRQKKKGTKKDPIPCVPKAGRRRKSAKPVLLKGQTYLPDYHFRPLKIVLSPTASTRSQETERNSSTKPSTASAEVSNVVLGHSSLENNSNSDTKKSSGKSKPKKKRRVRCRKCTNCRTPDCGECINCKDKRGPKKKHQACKRKPQCVEWSKPSGTPQDSGSTNPDGDLNNGSCDQSTESMERSEPQDTTNDDDDEFLEALKYGSVIIKTTKCTFFGPPGSGKSTLLSMIIDPKRKPVKRHSTPVAEKAVQATTCKLISTNPGDPLGTWVVFDGEQMIDVISNSVKKRHYKTLDETDTSASNHQSAANETEHDITSKLRDLTSSQARIPGNKEEVSRRLQLKLDLLRDARRRKTNHASFREIDLIYLVDAGGQPQFQEIVPLFVRNASVNALVFKLSERLRDCPQNTYWIDGQQFSEPEELKLTNEQLILYAAHSISSGTMHRKLPTAIESPEHPTVLLVGMFADKEHKEETKEDKQKFLEEKSSLRKNIDLDWLITLKRGNYIVDVDGSKTWLENNEEAEKQLERLQRLRSAILTQSEKLKVQVPLSWFLFLDELHNQPRNKYFLTLEECYVLGDQLEMSQKNVRAALEFLDELNIILYYPEYLPNIVFCQPQYLLCKVTDIIVSSFPCHAPDLDTKTGSRKIFREEGIFTNEILSRKEFKKGFNDKFSIEDLLYLLKSLLIIAEVDKSTYFMPCVLPYQDPKMIDGHYDPCVDPLWIYFMQHHTPRGLFCATIVHLTKSHENNTSLFRWVTVTDKSSKRETLLRKRNIMEFLLFSKYGPSSKGHDPEIGRVTIAATLSEFEIHTTCAVEHLMEIRANIESALKEAKKKLAYDAQQIDYTYGFLCHSKCIRRKRSQNEVHVRGRHVAKICNSNFTHCKCEYGSPRVLTKTQAPWFHPENNDQGSLKPKLVDLYNDLVFVTPEWQSLGLQLHVPNHKLDIIQVNNSHKCEDCLREMLQQWLNNSDDITWSAVANALEKMSKKDLAEKIRNKYHSGAYTGT